jgi:membrane protein DedA with SNARE-associated domain
LAPLLDRFGYLAIAGVLMLESFGVPLPGETILVVGSIYAGTGRLNAVLVAVVAVIAAVVGDNIGYAIGRFGGRRLALRFGQYVFLTPQRLAATERFFTRYGGGIVTVARFIEGLRQLNGIVAGITGMRWPRFLLFNILGATLWVAVWTALGYMAGSHITAIYDEIRQYERYALFAVVVLVLLAIARHLWRRFRRREDQDPAA